MMVPLDTSFVETPTLYCGPVGAAADAILNGCPGALMLNLYVNPLYNVMVGFELEPEL